MHRRRSTFPNRKYRAIVNHHDRLVLITNVSARRIAGVINQALSQQEK